MDWPLWVATLCNLFASVCFWTAAGSAKRREAMMERELQRGRALNDELARFLEAMRGKEP